MRDIISVIVAILAIVLFVALIYAAFGAVFYFGLANFGINLTFGQSLTLAVLIAVTGMLFRGNSGNTRKQAKGSE